MNIKFNYLYRDAGNYKNFGSAIFTNPDKIKIDYILNELYELLLQGEYFVPNNVGLPDLYFEIACDLDHIYHEFEGLELTSEPSDLNTTIIDLIRTLKSSYN